MMLLVVVWHWWIAPLLVAVAIVTIVATIAGYCIKVIKPRYPPEGSSPPEDREREES